MSVRPYPSRNRALRQILRRHHNEIPPELLPAPPMRQGWPGVYVLSKHRPGTVTDRPKPPAPECAPSQVSLCAGG